MSTKEDRRAVFQAFDAVAQSVKERPQSKVELAINWIMIQMNEVGDDRRVCFRSLSGRKFHTTEAAAKAIDEGEFCACVVDY